jgi:methionyl-tRNA formyltransferase
VRIVFAGTPEFAAVSLERLLAHGETVVAAYTQPDRPAGRGRTPRASLVKTLALAHGLAVEQPRTLRDEPAVATLAGYRPDLLVVAAYGLILPPAILDVPRLGCINVHASLLPRWRGAAPIQRAIMAGDTRTGITIMQMDAGLDTGAILRARACPIRPEDTGGTLHDRLAVLGADLLEETLDALARDGITPVSQPHEGVTYAHRLTVHDALLDWERSAAELERLIRAVDPWPVARTALDGQGLRVWRARVAAPMDHARLTQARPGQIIAATPAGIDVVTADGVLTLLRVQRPGRRPMDVKEYLNGAVVRPGDVFACAARLAETQPGATR